MADSRCVRDYFLATILLPELQTTSNGPQLTTEACETDSCDRFLAWLTTTDVSKPSVQLKLRKIQVELDRVCPKLQPSSMIDSACSSVFNNPTMRSSKHSGPVQGKQQPGEVSRATSNTEASAHRSKVRLPIKGTVSDQSGGISTSLANTRSWYLPSASDSPGIGSTIATAAGSVDSQTLARHDSMLSLEGSVLDGEDDGLRTLDGVASRLGSLCSHTRSDDENDPDCMAHAQSSAELDGCSIQALNAHHSPGYGRTAVSSGTAPSSYISPPVHAAATTSRSDQALLLLRPDMEGGLDNDLASDAGSAAWDSRSTAVVPESRRTRQAPPVFGAIIDDTVDGAEDDDDGGSRASIDADRDGRGHRANPMEPEPSLSLSSSSSQRSFTPADDLDQLLRLRQQTDGGLAPLPEEDLQLRRFSASQRQAPPARPSLAHSPVQVEGADPHGSGLGGQDISDLPNDEHVAALNRQLRMSRRADRSDPLASPGSRRLGGSSHYSLDVQDAVSESGTALSAAEALSLRSPGPSRPAFTPSPSGREEMESEAALSQSSRQQTVGSGGRGDSGEGQSTRINPQQPRAGTSQGDRTTPGSVSSMDRQVQALRVQNSPVQLQQGPVLTASDSHSPMHEPHPHPMLRPQRIAHRTATQPTNALLPALRHPTTGPQSHLRSAHTQGMTGLAGRYTRTAPGRQGALLAHQQDQPLGPHGRPHDAAQYRAWRHSGDDEAGDVRHSAQPPVLPSAEGLLTPHWPSGAYGRQAQPRFAGGRGMGDVFPDANDDFRSDTSVGAADFEGSHIMGWLAHKANDGDVDMDMVADATVKRENGSSDYHGTVGSTFDTHHQTESMLSGHDRTFGERSSSGAMTLDMAWETRQSQHTHRFNQDSQDGGMLDRLSPFGDSAASTAGHPAHAPPDTRRHRLDEAQQARVAALRAKLRMALNSDAPVHRSIISPAPRPAVARRPDGPTELQPAATAGRSPFATVLRSLQAAVPVSQLQAAQQTQPRLSYAAALSAEQARKAQRMQPPPFRHNQFGRLGNRVRSSSDAYTDDMTVAGPTQTGTQGSHPTEALAADRGVHHHGAAAGERFVWTSNVENMLRDGTLLVANELRQNLNLPFLRRPKQRRPSPRQPTATGKPHAMDAISSGSESSSVMEDGGGGGGQAVGEAAIGEENDDVGDLEAERDRNEADDDDDEDDDSSLPSTDDDEGDSDVGSSLARPGSVCGRTRQLFGLRTGREALLHEDADLDTAVPAAETLVKPAAPHSRSRPASAAQSDDSILDTMSEPVGSVSVVQASVRSLEPQTTEPGDAPTVDGTPLRSALRGDTRQIPSLSLADGSLTSHNRRGVDISRLETASPLSSIMTAPSGARSTRPVGKVRFGGSASVVEFSIDEEAHAVSSSARSESELQFAPRESRPDRRIPRSPPAPDKDETAAT